MELDSLHEGYLGAEDFQCCADKGEDQTNHLKAQNLMDYITPDLRLDKVCRANTNTDPFGNACACGSAYPAKMWHQPNKNMWKFFCKVDWSMLKKAGDDFAGPEYSKVAHQFEDQRWPGHHHVA